MEFGSHESLVAMGHQVFFPKGRPRRTCSPPKFIRFYHMCETTQKDLRDVPMSSTSACEKACDTSIMATLGFAGRATHKSHLLLYLLSFHTLLPFQKPNHGTAQTCVPLPSSKTCTIPSHVRDHPKRPEKTGHVECVCSSKSYMRKFHDDSRSYQTCDI